jgi:hypothetical protein
MNSPRCGSPAAAASQIARPVPQPSRPASTRPPHHRTAAGTPGAHQAADRRQRADQWNPGQIPCGVPRQQALGAPAAKPPGSLSPDRPTGYARCASGGERAPSGESKPGLKLKDNQPVQRQPRSWLTGVPSRANPCGSLPASHVHVTSMSRPERRSNDGQPILEPNHMSPEPHSGLVLRVKLWGFETPDLLHASSGNPSTRVCSRRSPSSCVPASPPTCHENHPPLAWRIF